jgi:hypothetical protein
MFRVVPDGYDDAQAAPLQEMLPLPLPVVVALKVTVGGTCPKVAVTVVSLLKVTVHVPVPEQPPPDQPVNPDPASGLAVRMTVLPPVRVTEQVLPQASAGDELDVTVPLPLPAFVTLSTAVAGMALKVAVTVVFAQRGKVQDPMPVQSPPDQPAKLDPACGVAARVMLVPQGADAGQTPPLQETLPAPEPPV